jgi:hypothetical protein
VRFLAMDSFFDKILVGRHLGNFCRPLGDILGGSATPCASPHPWSSLFLIILFLSTTLPIEMTGISLHMQRPLTSQSHGSILKENYWFYCYGKKLHSLIRLEVSPPRFGRFFFSKASGPFVNNLHTIDSSPDAKVSSERKKEKGSVYPLFSIRGRYFFHKINYVCCLLRTYNSSL